MNLRLQIAIDSANYAMGYDRRSSTPQLSSELLSSQIEKEKTEATETIAKETSSDLKPEFNKVREKLREVIKVERQNEKEGTTGPPPDNRTTFFQHATGLRLQPPVRLDFHPGIRPRPQRFQGSPHFRPPFLPEHGIDIRPNFRPDFPPRFNHGPKNFNISPRLQGPQMIPPEFNGRTIPRVGSRQVVDHVELNMQVNFDPREPPPRFNAPVFNPNEFPPKFCPPSGLNRFQPPSGFYQHGPPPRFVNQDQNSAGLPPSFNPNLGTSSPVADFSPLVPPSYNQIPPMHCSSFPPVINGSFNPAMPPPNPGSCMVPKFPPPSMPSSASSSSCSSPFTTEAQTIMQLPPMPMNSLEIQPPPPPPPHPPPVPPPPPPSGLLDNVSKSKNERNSSQRNDGVTPNMNDELEDMQEALEFAKQLMSMTNDDSEDDIDKFNVLMFPDLTSIPSTKPSHIEQELPTCESENDNSLKQSEIHRLRDVEQGDEFNTRIVREEPITKEELLMVKNEDEQLLLDVQIRPKVMFNVNSRSKKIARINEWQSPNNENSVRPKEPTEKMPDFSTPIVKEGEKKDWETLLSKEGSDSKLSEKRSKQKESQQRRDENKEQETRTFQDLLGSPIVIEDVNSSYKDIANDVIDQSRKLRGLSSKLSSKSLLIATVDANWKDKVINQFLKMSKNDICNMVNSSGLRKFDIAMKHLVKERKYSLSQERRSSADDAVKGYDMSREEFMNQLSAMLDPSATVDIKNLPSKFIQHLSEVLKLDVKSHLSDSIESWPAPSSGVTNNMDVNYNNGICNNQNNFSDRNNDQNFGELLDPDVTSMSHPGDDDLSVQIKTEIRPTQAIQISSGFSNLFTDTQSDNGSIIVRDNIASIDDIFPAGLLKAKLVEDSVTHQVAPAPLEQEKNIDGSNGQFSPYKMIRVKGLTTMQSSQENLSRGDMLTSRTDDEVAAEGRENFSEDKFQEKHENIEGWNKRKRQDLDMFRNLTKEEWEAKYSETIETELVPSQKETLPRSTNSPRSMGLKDENSNRNQSSLSSLKETNRNADYIREINDLGDKSPGEKDYNLVTDNDKDIRSNCGSRSSEDDRSAPSDVTEFLEVIKSREKLAKNMSIDQTIEEKVTAEIELIERKDQEHHRECKIGENESDTRSKEPRDKQKWNNSSLESDNRIQKDTMRKEVFNETEMEFKKDERLNRVGNVEPSESNSNLRGPDEPSKGNFEEEEREQIEFLKNSKDIISPVIQEFTREILPTEALQSNYDKIGEALNKEKESDQSESSTPVENHLDNLKLEEIKNTLNDKTEMQLNKPGVKKIDIQAYKARKLQRNNDKRDGKSGEMETVFPLLDTGSANILHSHDKLKNNTKERQNKESSENATGENENENECKQKNSSDNVQMTKLKESQQLVNIQNSTKQHSQKERSNVPKSNSARKDERKSRNDTKLDKHQHSERSKEKLYSDEKFDKKRSRNYSRDSHRSRSREENRRTSKEKSKRSFQEIIRRPKSENNLCSKSQYDKYNSQSKDKKPAKHRASDVSKETHEKIDKREKNKNIVGERPEHKRSSREHYDAKKKVYRGESHISDKISANKMTAEDSQQRYDTENDKIAENLTLVMKPTNGEQRDEELLTGVMQIPIKLGVSRVVINESTELSLGNEKTLGNDSSSSKAKEMSDLTKTDGAEDSSHFNQETVTRIDSESINSEDLRANAKSLSLENKDHSVENDSKACSATEEGVLKLNETRQDESNNNSDLADKKTESLSHETTEKTKVMQKFNDKLKHNLQPNENEVKLVIENLIQRVISESDLLNQENEDQDGILRGDNAEIMISSPAALELGPEELHECTILDLNSPGTPESPLKGFSEETIKNSILGKRKLARSVLKITEDYIQDKGSKDFNETILKIVTERDIICENFEELTSYKKSEDINALLAANIGSKNFHTDTENSLGDNQECYKEVGCDERRVDEKIKPIGGENEKNTDDAIIVNEKNETCARSLTPSGDTLSLGSSIDFNNSEFIVLSEISSDENFSQDDERKREITLMLENEEMNTKSEIQKKTEKTIISSNTSHRQKDDNIEASTIAQSTKFETNQSSNELNLISSQIIDSNVPVSTKPCNVDVFSNSSQSELESNQSQDNNPSNATETITASILKERKEQPPREKDNSSKNKCMNDERVSPCCDSIQSNNPTIENVNAKKIFSIDSEADFNKTDKVTKKTESERSKNTDVVSKGNLLPRESNTDKHMHRIKRTHKTKHKKDKERKLDEKKIKESLKNKDSMTLVEKPRTKERVLARMVEIDIEIHKLMSEKIKLLQMIESDILPTELPKLESAKESIKEFGFRLPSKENNGAPVKMIKVDSKTKFVSSHPKSSKNLTNDNSEYETSNRGNGKEKKTRKKTDKRDRSSSQDKSIPETESTSVSLHKKSSKKSADTKSTVTRREKNKKYDSQSNRQRGGGSSSSNSQHEKYTTGTDQEVTFTKNTDQATLNKSLFEVCKNSTKVDNHGRSQKKANKISVSRENNVLQLKKEVQHCELNDEVKPVTKTGCESFNNASTKEQLPEICIDEGNQKSECLEQKRMNKNSNGLLLLEESYRRDKMALKKPQASFSLKKKKGTMKCSSESNIRSLSPTEEEMPLQLLYLKKCQKKLEPLKSTESSSRNDKSRILKLKRRRSTEVLKHVMKVIDAVAQNKIGEYQKTNKVKVKSEGTVHREAEKVRRKEKILVKIKPHSTHMSNRSATSESEDVWTVANVQNCSNRRNCDESFKKCNQLDSDKNSVGSLGRKSVMSVQESDDKSSIVKIIDTPGEYKEDVGEVSPFKDFYEENMSEIFHGDNETDILSEQWNIAEDETFNYTDDVPQFLDSASDLVPHDPTSRSNSTPCNFHMEKGLDIVDLMLETVDGDFEKTSNDVSICNVEKKKRKWVTSGDKESENNFTVKRMAHMTRSEMMNCSVRLVDCKYTHLKNYPISRVCRKSKSSTVVSEKSTESTYSEQCNRVHPLQIKTPIESYAQTAKLKDHFPSEPTFNKEPNAVTEYFNWSSEKAHLLDNDKIVQSPSTDPLTGKSGLKKNNMEEKSENTENNLEIIESETPSGLQFHNGENGFSAGLTEAGNPKSFIQMQKTDVTVTANAASNFSSGNQSKECDEEATVISETQGKTSLKFEVNTSAARKQLTEYGLRTKPLSKLVDPEIHNRETNAKKVDDTEDQVQVLTNNMTEENLTKQHTNAQETCDVQIINQFKTNEDIEVQEVELPRIQYSVHKGPILDLKVNNWV